MAYNPFGSGSFTWITTADYVVGQNHATLPDVANRITKEIVRRLKLEHDFDDDTAPHKDITCLSINCSSMITSASGSFTDATITTLRTTDIYLSGNIPDIYFTESDEADPEQRNWTLRVNSGAFKLHTLDSAFGSAQNVFQANRSGNSPTTFQIAPYLTRKSDGVHCSLDGNQTNVDKVSYNNTTIVKFQDDADATYDRDDNNCWNNGTWLYTVKAEGWYRIDASVDWANAAVSGTRQLLLYIDGVAVFGHRQASDTDNALTTVLNTRLYLLLNQTIQIRVYHNTDAHATLTDNAFTFLSICKD